MNSRHAPPTVRAWLSNRPPWLEISGDTLESDDSLDHLDRGERDAILLAQHSNAERLIVDESAARLEATKRGIPIMGTLGVLVEASRRGLLRLPEAIQSLQATSFYASDKLLDALLALDRQTGC